MHELSLCRSIHGIVERARGGRKVERVNLRVGQLRQVVPETLEYCWGLVVSSSPLADSRLVVESVPATVRCRACGETGELGHVLLVACRACGSAEVEICTGEELLVTSIDLAPQPPVAVGGKGG